MNQIVGIIIINGGNPGNRCVYIEDAVKKQIIKRIAPYFNGSLSCIRMPTGTPRIIPNQRKLKRAGINKRATINIRGKLRNRRILNVNWLK